MAKYFNIFKISIHHLLLATAYLKKQERTLVDDRNLSSNWFGHVISLRSNFLTC